MLSAVCALAGQSTCGGGCLVLISLLALCARRNVESMRFLGIKVPAISKHLKNIYESGELERNATISKMETVVNRGFRGSSLEVVDHSHT